MKNMNFYERVFGAATTEEILKQKSDSKQIRATAGGKDNQDSKITEEECRAYCKATNNLEYLSGYENRVRQYTITDESVDRYGDIVRASGVSLANYLKNPVVQFAHDYTQPPVGFSIRTWFDKGTNTIKALALFLDERVDTTGRSDLIFRLVKTNGMRACSIGFDPIETYHPKNESERTALGLGEYGVEYRSSDLLEFSPVPLPANPNALSDSYRRAYNDSFSKSLRSGLFTAADVGVLKKYPLFDDSILDIFVRELGIKSVAKAGDDPQEGQDEQEKPSGDDAAVDISKPYPNEHAARVREPEEFEPDSFRRKNVADGVDMIIGKLKGEEATTAQAYRFDKTKFTIDQAKTWLDENEVEYISFEAAAETEEGEEGDEGESGDESQPENESAKSAPVKIFLDLGTIIKEIQSIKEIANSTAALLKAAQESFDATSKKFDAMTIKTSAAVETLTRRASFYDNQKADPEKDVRGILGLKK